MNESNLIDSLMQQARLQPQAALFASDTQSIAFAEMNRRANQLANALRSLDIGPGSRVAILGRSQVDCALLVFAAMKIGAACVPVNWRFSVEEIRFVLEDSGARVLIADTEFSAQGAQAAGPGGVCVFLTDCEADDPARLDLWCAGFDDQLPPRDVLPDDAAIHMYSSGTTGRPKGVVLTHRGLVSACEVIAQAWKLDRNAVLAHALPTFHIAGMLQLLFPIYVGCRCVIFREFQPEVFLRALSGEKITHVLVVPAMIGFLLAHPVSRTLDFASLRLMAYGGSPITEPVLEAAMEVFGCDFSQIYGLTEVCGVVTALTAEDHRRGAGLLRSAGRPMPRTALRIVDPLTLADLEDGRVGEVWIRSDRNFKAYWQKSEATQEAFPEGRDAEGGWFRSGDAGYLQDGYLFLSDRIKDMIVSGGENIYPAEVENTLMKHPDVADGAVIGVPDAVWGESVKACVVLRPGATANADHIIDFMRERIAHFKCPKTVDFVAALPRTESGKLLKRDLRAPYWAGHLRAIH
ncbi:acyl-CoA synthetase (AMP-forming)/AMP-acid ligase II [Variovorax sp. 54]|uniref:long-chain-fatty-acid--CoA ligase n=1 Tax=Variovorax sp. 54 TaxID=2035212 RepID=UPI000C505950|nr:long-chain-fatty-acid--CoA ligase [Variovorax sp. 54]PIF74787.1 acyl-CoA synthetase (AMP-forming)/AMP-acid ligase II [Variovorax sp. 54]